MPNFDRSGPQGLGSQTGKKLGKCSFSDKGYGLGQRMKQNGRGCKGNSNGPFEPFSMKNTEIVGIKRCKKKHQ